MKKKLKYMVMFICISIFHMNSVTAEELPIQTVNLENLSNNQDVFATRNEELTALLNWASYLSGYSTNGINPQLKFKSHQFFVDNACLGNLKCKVVGWYNDQGVVYIDDRLTSLESRFERSLVVHEFVHYLQHISGKFKSGTCESFVQREREAYATQREFIMTYGVAPSMTFHQHSCAIDLVKEGV